MKIKPSKLQCPKETNINDTHSTEVLIIRIAHSLIAFIQVQLAQIIVRTDGLNLIELTHTPFMIN